MLRKQGKWMSKWDDRLLEFIKENGSGAPTEISNADHIPISKQYASKRLKELEKQDLLEALGNGVYQITTEGLMYLYGDYDAEEGKIIADIDVELEEMSDITLPNTSEDEKLKRIYLTKLSEQDYSDKIREYMQHFLRD